MLSVLIRSASCVASLIGLVWGPGPSVAQTFPARPISLVVPYAAGGPTDVIARLIAQSMSATLGQQVVVENVTGAGGTLGAARVAKAEPDGHALLVHHVALAAAPALYKSLPYETIDAFAPVGLINFGPFVLTGRTGLDARTPQEALNLLKARGDGLTMAHAGEGSGSHLCGIMLTQALETKVTYVPYKGTGPAMTDLLGGQVDLLCDQTTNALPQIQSGKIQAYAVTSAARIEQAPNLPSFQELGFKDFDVTTWHALYAPRGTPRATVEKLNGALQTALADPAVVKRFTDLGTQLFPEGRRSPEALGETLKAQVKTWAAALTAAGVQKQ